MTSSHTMTASTKNWVIANWKMHPKSSAEVKSLSNDLMQNITALEANCGVLPEIAIAPSFLHLATLAQLLSDSPIELAGQNLCEQDSSHGAYTGEVSANQLVDIGVTSVIIGHSERRQYFAESNAILTKKIENAFAHELSVIFCIGESHEQYLAKQTNTVLKGQLEILAHFTSQIALPNPNASANKPKLLVAYEPIWAIGTGLTPTPQEIEAVHAFISETLSTMQIYAPIIYGGSVNANNASSIAEIALVDGVLVGGASLNADSFCQIIEAFC